MTNYILRCANSWRTKCRVRFNPAPQKDAISEPGLPRRAVSQDTNETFPAYVKQTAPLWREQQGSERHVSGGRHAGA